MSDTPQGPDWWQASDDKWYPPPRPDMPGNTMAYPAAPPTAPLGPGGPAGPYAPAGPPTPSPYGGVPAVPPPGPGGQNRTPLFIALGVLMAVAAVVVIFAVASGDDDDDPQASPDTTEPEDSPITTRDVDTTEGGPTETTASADPPAEGEITLVESGFSGYHDELSEADETAYAFVVENTSDQVARNVSITIGLLDASGTVLDADTESIYVLMPGQTFGIGDAGFPPGVTDLDIQISEPSEWADPADFGEVTAEGISWEYDSFSDPIVSFTATSTYDSQLDGPRAYAIFRDASGNLIGGYSTYMNFIAPGGSTAGQVETFDSIANVETAEVYIDPAIF